MKKTNLIIHIYSALLATMVYFGYLFNSYYPIVIVSIILGLCIVLHQKGKLTITRNQLGWVSLIGAFMVGGIYSMAQGYILGYIAPISLLLILSIICSNIQNKDWYKLFVNYAILFGIVHVLCTILYQINPTLIGDICKAILKPTEFEINRYLMKYGGNPGITGQTGVNGWFISITIGFLTHYLFNSKMKPVKRILLFLLIIVSIIALLLTNKRSFIIFSAASFIISYVIVAKNTKRNTKILLAISIIITIIATLTINNNAITVFDRFSDNGTDISSGRYLIYSKMINQFSAHPLFGIGTLSTIHVANNLGHNIYLQVLCENGIIVFIYFICFVIINIYNTCKSKINKTANPIIATCRYVFILFFLYGLTGNPIYTIQDYSILLIASAYINRLMKEKQHE